MSISLIISNSITIQRVEHQYLNHKKKSEQTLVRPDHNKYFTKINRQPLQILHLLHHEIDQPPLLYLFLFHFAL